MAGWQIVPITAPVEQWHDAPAGQRWAGRLGVLVSLVNALFMLALLMIVSSFLNS